MSTGQTPKDLSRPAEGGTQNGNATSDGNQSLSDKLDKSGGVVKPAEGVDPQMVQPAPVPDPKSTPVIPPAGTPGARAKAQIVAGTHRPRRTGADGFLTVVDGRPT